MCATCMHTTDNTHAHDMHAHDSRLVAREEQPFGWRLVPWYGRRRAVDRSGVKKEMLVLSAQGSTCKRWSEATGIVGRALGCEGGGGEGGGGESGGADGGEGGGGEGGGGRAARTSLGGRCSRAALAVVVPRG